MCIKPFRPAGINDVVALIEIGEFQDLLSLVAHRHICVHTENFQPRLLEHLHCLLRGRVGGQRIHLSADVSHVGNLMYRAGKILFQFMADGIELESNIGNICFFVSETQFPECKSACA